MLLFWIFLFSCTGCHWTIEEMHASSVGGIFVGSLFAAQAELNLYLLAFNLLVPCLPLDGATVIVSGLVGCGLRPLTAAKVVVAMSCWLRFATISLASFRPTSTWSTPPRSTRPCPPKA